MGLVAIQRGSASFSIAKALRRTARKGEDHDPERALQKDVIQVPLGANLGRADDLRFDPQTAALEGLVLLGRPRLFGLLGRQEDVFIPWREIDAIGADVILVRTQLPTGTPKARGGFWARLLE